MTHTPDLADRLADVVGARGVLRRPARARRVSQRRAARLLEAAAARASFRGTRDETIAVVRLLAETKTAVRPARRGHGIVRRRARRRRRAASASIASRASSRSTPTNALAVVEPGVVNVALTRAATPYGLHYAPDPSSQTACTIGGNVAENAGGPHCLKYGVTLNHVLALTVHPSQRRDRHARQRRGRGRRLRPARRVHRLGGLLRHRARCHGATLAQNPAVDPHAARRLHVHRCCRARRLGDHRVGHRAGGARDDGRRDDPRRRGVDLRRRLSRPTPRPSCSSSSTARRAGLDADVATRRGAVHDAGARDGSHRARRCGSRAALAGAKESVRRDGPRLVAPRRTGRGRSAHASCPTCSPTIHEIGERTSRARSATCSTPATATCTRTSATTRTIPTSRRASTPRCGRSWRPASTAGGTITGEHGIGLDKLDYMDLIFSPDSLAAMCRLREVFDPDAPREPGQGRAGSQLSRVARRAEGSVDA